MLPASTPNTTLLGEVLPAEPGCPVSAAGDPEGCYYTLNALVERGIGVADWPIQPYFVYDSRLSGTSQHGVLWLGGEYEEENDWIPVFAELVSNGGDASQPWCCPAPSPEQTPRPPLRAWGGPALLSPKRLGGQQSSIYHWRGSQGTRIRRDVFDPEDLSRGRPGSLLFQQYRRQLTELRPQWTATSARHL